MRRMTTRRPAGPSPAGQRVGWAVLFFSMLITTIPSAQAAGTSSLRERLKAEPVKIAWERYVDGNSEIFVMNADGSNPTNLTKTPKEHEHYPQVSPDGTKICFNVDSGEG